MRIAGNIVAFALKNGRRAEVFNQDFVCLHRYMNQEPPEYVIKVLTSQTGRSLTKLLDLLRTMRGVS